MWGLNLHGEDEGVSLELGRWGGFEGFVEMGACRVLEFPSA